MKHMLISKIKLLQINKIISNKNLIKIIIKFELLFLAILIKILIWINFFTKYVFTEMFGLLYEEFDIWNFGDDTVHFWFE